ncbi:MAG: flagellar filament capping protein FliD [Deltaproteobacteria bacterium]|nr:flagellar filament capping protein FliD [Deltaproteobacteria bacterium]
MATTSGISSISTYYQPAITFSGLGSSVDFDSIIKKLVEVESASKTRYESWKTEWNDKITALQTLNTKMSDFRTVAQGMDTLSQFVGKTAASSNTSVLTASASTTATSGTHQVLVNQLAQNEIEVHQGLADSATVVNNSGSAKVFAFSYAGGAAVSISVANGATLADLAAAINSSGANPGVTATVLDMGASFGATRYRLQLQGNSTGSTNTITIDDALTTLDGTGSTVNFESTTFTTAQTAQNAQIRVDGYPAGTWIERSTNVIGDVIPGVTLSLLNSSATSVQVTINDDTGAMQDKIESLVEKYNDVVAYIKEQTKYDTTTDTAGILLGNYAVEIVKSALNYIGTGNAPGFKDPNDPYLNLGKIGITTDSDETSDTFGQLVIDSSALAAALGSNPTGVARLMAAYFRGVSDDATGNITYYSSLPGITQPGIYDVTATVSGGVLTGGTINGHAATVSGDTLTGQSGYAEYGLAVKINLVDGNYNGTVRLQLGKNGQFAEKLDDLLSASSGPVNILINNYQDIIDGIDAKIEAETRRVEGVQKRLREQFARVDAILSTLNQQSQYLSTQLSKLNSSSS